MYYYILESPSTKGTIQTYNRLKDALNFLGIAGEFAMANPARTPTELCKMALQKGYTTVVAVGGDKTINEVAKTIIGQAVLGIVPIGASGQITRMIGGDDLKTATEALKQRHVVEVNTVLAEPDTILFLDTIIYSQNPAKIYMVVDNKLKVQAYFNEIVIDKNLNVSVKGEFLSRDKAGMFGFLGIGKKTISSESLFHGKVVKIMTEPVMTLYSGVDAIGRTPAALRLIPESLKIITRRGNIS